ncbi:hypothetical protein RSAG8_00574, partial [Rhizoctonia solani AG-8 WAC10335]
MHVGTIARGCSVPARGTRIPMPFNAQVNSLSARSCSHGVCASYNPLKVWRNVGVLTIPGANA